MALTDGVGVDATLECVGTGQAIDTAFSIARPGSMVGYVGIPHGVELPLQEMFFRNKGLLGGTTPVRAYIRSYSTTSSGANQPRTRARLRDRPRPHRRRLRGDGRAAGDQVARPRGGSLIAAALRRATGVNSPEGWSCRATGVHLGDSRD